MFTGIVQSLGHLSRIEPSEKSSRLLIATGFNDLELGESVAVNGVCLTVVESTPRGDAWFFVSRETLECTNLGSFDTGARVNLERALTLQTRLSGHLVQGHVDGVGHLESVTPVEDAFELSFKLPGALGRYCIEKGSIALDGISLTLNAVEDQSDGTTRVRIMIIPHTWTHTRLHALPIGGAVNVEVDLMAKYAERLWRK